MRLVQVLSNLLNNAITFTEQGEIDLSVSVEAGAGNAGNSSQSRILFAVKDTGIGIDKSKQASLFEAFKQADESMTREYGGTGLGLSICQHIAQLLHGEISIESELGAGAEFTLAIPLAYATGSAMFPDGILSLRQVLANYSLVSFAVAIPASLQQNLHDIEQNIVAIENIKELKPLSENSNSILLLDSAHIQHGFSEHDMEIISRSVAIVALCQPISSAISKQLLAQFSNYNIPYLLLELPLYRQAIVKIAQEVNKLPLITKHQEHAPVTAQPEASLAAMRILLVEDNLVNQLVAIKLLESMQVKVIVANNGQEALNILSQEKVDLVLMDIQMPVMDGLTATQHIRAQQQFNNLPILAMTAHAREEDKQQCLAAGMNLHLAKPITLKVLRDSILSVI